MTTLVLQAIIALSLFYVSVCAFVKSDVVSVKIPLVFTAIGSVGMIYIIVAQYFGAEYYHFKDFYRMSVLLITASELAIVVALREYSKWM